MRASGTLRLVILRNAVALGVLLSLLTLLVPNEFITKLDVIGLGRDWGAGRTLAADLSPNTVGTSTSDVALMASTQRKLFYAAGRFWVFYCDNDELVYKSSSDGFSWSEKSASLGASSRGTGTSVHFDGIYVHYARTTSANSRPLHYRRGIPTADGTIAWSKDEQIAVVGAAGVRYLYPSVSVNSSGHALISYHFERQAGDVGEGPYITMSGNNDGTWGVTPAGFPYMLASASESEWYTTVHGLTSDKIAVTFADQTEIQTVYVRTYDGSSWNSAQSTASTAHFGSGYSVVAEGDDLHIVLLDQATFDIRYSKYSYATNSMEPESTVRGSELLSSAPALALTSDNDLYCFWINSPTDGHIYYSRMISGVWDDDCTDWLTETNLTASGGISTFYNQGSSAYIGVAWETGLASPYEIRFGAVQTISPPNQPPDQPANVSPASGETEQSLTPVLQSSDFFDPDGDGHLASQWQIRAAAGDYSSPIFDSQTDTTNLVSILVSSGDLAHSTTYYWRVRHQDDQGAWSEWSTETSFTTVSAPSQPPNQPVNVSPASGVTDQSLTPTLQSSGFSDPDVGDTHAASQWQLRMASGDYSSAVFDSERDTENLVNIGVSPVELTYSTTYYWRVRHQDDQGAWSEWSTETLFITYPGPATPEPTPGPAPALPGDSGGGLPLWITVGVPVTIGLLATLIIGIAAYFACGSLLATTMPTTGSGLNCVDAISKRLKDQNKGR